ncbi:hypothetical protein ACOME3_004404 [Neoechinorhynchus agilis]
MKVLCLLSSDIRVQNDASVNFLLTNVIDALSYISTRNLIVPLNQQYQVAIHHDAKIFLFISHVRIVASQWNDVLRNCAKTGILDEFRLLCELLLSPWQDGLETDKSQLTDRAGSITHGNQHSCDEFTASEIGQTSNYVNEQ